MKMNETKRKQLNAAGWTVGSADEFVGLTEAESAYVSMKLAVGRKIRELRVTNTMTQVELARLVRSSQSRIAKMESGDPSISLDLLVRTVLALGASRDQVARYLMHKRA
jgi:DNA-binding XRE family transcriptional regulator